MIYFYSKIIDQIMIFFIWNKLQRQVLAALIDQHNRDENRDKNKEVIIHFVEDRFETLLAVMKIPALDSVQLYLVDWGYNTRTQREEAKKLFPRVKLINGEDFKALATSFIQWWFQIMLRLLYSVIEMIWCAVIWCAMLCWAAFYDRLFNYKFYFLVDA